MHGAMTDCSSTQHTLSAYCETDIVLCTGEQSRHSLPLVFKGSCLAFLGVGRVEKCGGVGEETAVEKQVSRSLQ